MINQEKNPNPEGDISIGVIRVTFLMAFDTPQPSPLTHTQTPTILSGCRWPPNRNTIHDLRNHPDRR